MYAMKKYIMLSILALFVGGVSAADDKYGFKITPTGTILLDGALYASPQKHDFKDGVAIPDVRLGAKMQYGKWKATIDAGFAYNKLGLKDVFIEYDINQKNLVRAGSFIHQYGLQSATGSSMKVCMEEPVSNAVFNDSRQIGVMYKHIGDKFFATASVHVEPKATTVILRPDQFTQEGYGFRSRLVYRNIHEASKVFQVGVSGGFATPQNVDDADMPHDAFQFKSIFPTRVAQVTAIDAVVDKAMNLWKFTPELLVSYGRLAIESQYYFQQVNRRGGFHNFQGHGAYAIVRGLLLNGNYGYSMSDAALKTPGKGSLEAVVCYNYTSLTDTRAAICGGRLNGVSVTLNYYINKYILARLHYSYTHTWDRAGAPDVSLNGFMARLQVRF